MKLDITNKIYNDDDAARAHLEEQLWPAVRSALTAVRSTPPGLKARRTARACYQCND